MVSTRHHPREFPAPDLSPTKSSPRKSSRQSTSSPAPGSPTSNGSSSTSFAKRVAANTFNTSTSIVSSTTSSSSSPKGWSHTASNLTILWVAISIPLVIWDSLYILLRPHTMAGGRLQWPIWKPYEIYAAIDHVYGAPGWENKDGFGGAQGALNAIEVVMYGLYFLIVYHHGVPSAGGRGLQVGSGVRGWISGGRRVEGWRGNRAVLLGFAASVMTLSKTVLYYFNEYFSDFRSVRHNDWATLFLFYGVMNGLWVIFPAYMTVVFGLDITEALDIASESSDAASKKKY